MAGYRGNPRFSTRVIAETPPTVRMLTEGNNGRVRFKQIDGAVVMGRILALAISAASL